MTAKRKKKQAAQTAEASNENPLLEEHNDDGDVSDDNILPRKRRPHQNDSQANRERMHTGTKSCVTVDVMQGAILDAPLSGDSKGI